jgi:hypothetical protein
VQRAYEQDLMEAPVLLTFGSVGGAFANTTVTFCVHVPTGSGLTADPISFVTPVNTTKTGELDGANDPFDRPTAVYGVKTPDGAVNIVFRDATSPKGEVGADGQFKPASGGVQVAELVYGTLTVYPNGTYVYVPDPLKVAQFPPGTLLHMSRRCL